MCSNSNSLELLALQFQFGTNTKLPDFECVNPNALIKDRCPNHVRCQLGHHNPCKLEYASKIFLFLDGNDYGSIMTKCSVRSSLGPVKQL